MPDTSPPVSTNVRTGHWTCPLCGESKSVLVLGSGAQNRPLSDLKNHIKSQIHNGHGPRWEFPSEFDPEMLDAYVEQPKPMETDDDESNEWQTVQEEMKTFRRSTA